MSATTSKITNAYSNYEKAFDDWLGKGSKAMQAAKSFGAMGVIAAVFGGMIYGATLDERQEVADTISALNQQDTIVFMNQSDCTDQGFDSLSCKASQENAIDLSQHFSVPVQPMNFNECVDKFGSCPDQSKLFAGGRKLDISQYKPVLGPWQAVKGDIAKSAQMYSTSDANTYLRIDGQHIKI